MKLELHEQVAIVTGGGQGLGAAIAHTLATAGARIVVNDINPDRAERVASEIRQAGGEAIGVAADVSSKFQCVHLVETARAQWGRLDILINNAGVAPAVPILKMDEWDWDRCLGVNLKGTFMMSQLAGRVMADENRARGGVIVNIAAPAGTAPPAAPRRLQRQQSGCCGLCPRVRPRIRRLRHSGEHGAAGDDRHAPGGQGRGWPGRPGRLAGGDSAGSPGGPARSGQCGAVSVQHG